MSSTTKTSRAARADVIRLLKQRGWLGSGSADQAAMRKALRRFQRWAGLKVDGVVGPVTWFHLAMPRICGTPDTTDTSTCKWPMKQVTWNIADALPGISDAAFKDAVSWAGAQWSAACDIELDYTANHRTANILIRVANLGGPGGTLADSTLPCGATQASQMRQRYDKSEVWHPAPGRPPNGRISLPTVVAHELGHAIGIGHISPQRGVALMNPTYDPDVLTPRRLDAEEAIRRYGPPTNGKPPVEKPQWRISFLTSYEPTVERLDD